MAEQGTEEWRMERCGKVTASRFIDVMTSSESLGSVQQAIVDHLATSTSLSKADYIAETLGKRKGDVRKTVDNLVERGRLRKFEQDYVGLNPDYQPPFGSSATRYMYDLITEHLTGQPQDLVSARALEWGHKNEPQARALYSWLTKTSIVQVGLQYHRELHNVAGSPDGLIGTDGGLELKCPENSRIHLEYMEQGGVPRDYVWQVQGLMWVTERQWWDFASFDPRMPDSLQLYTHRAARDEAMIERLDKRVRVFLRELSTKLENIRSRADVA